MGVPPEGKWEQINKIRLAAAKARLLLTWLPIAAVVQQEEAAQLRRDRAEFIQGRLEKLRELAPHDVLAEKVKDGDPEVRLAAVQVAGLQRVHLEADLIDRLNDKEPEVRRAARRALVRLARGTDFGPRGNADRAERRQAVRRWSKWWSLQDTNTQAPTARATNVSLANDQGQAHEGNTANHQDSSAPKAVLETVDATAARLAFELIQAPAEEQEELLIRLKEGKGVIYTEALAAAIPELAPEWQSQARDALAQRLTRMTGSTLRDKFQDEDAEVRSGAARATALKDDKTLIPDMLRLLDDSEPAVVHAAHLALKRLSGKDFGPGPNANRGDRIFAIAAWHSWWKKQNAKK